MQRLDVLLLDLFCRYETHVWTAHGFTNGFCVVGIVLVGLDVRLHELRGDQPNVVPAAAQHAHPIVRSATSLQSHCAHWQVRKKSRDLAPTQFLAKDYSTVRIHSVDLKELLGDIKTNCCKAHGCPSQDCDEA